MLNRTQETVFFPLLSRSINNEQTKEMALSKFIANTIEQVARFEEIKKYPPKLLSFRKQLASDGVQCHFNMYSILLVEIKSPLDKSPMVVMLKEYNSQDVCLSSPRLPYTILFEDCFNGLDLVKRMREAGML